MMLSRSTFYPAPPSTYPRPIVHPGPAYETTTAFEHGEKKEQETNFYRPRTFNPASAKLSAQQAPSQGYPTMYAQHGIGQYSLPYYRRDSNGFRRTYHQPAPVDNWYEQAVEPTQRDRLAASGVAWAHPSSRSGYVVRKNLPGQGPTFSTSYRNSGLYSQRADEPLVTDIHEHLQQLHQTSSTTTLAPTLASTLPVSHSTGAIRSVSSAPAELSSRIEVRQILSDPLLPDPIENAHRRPRTVYKRSYGLCQ